MYEIENSEEAEIQIEINAASIDLPALLEELQSLPSFAEESVSDSEEPPQHGPESHEN